MARGGHNRKPTALHLLQGTGRPSRLKKNEPKPQPMAPTCPDWLDPEAKREWKRVAPQLERLGLLTVLDRAALACYCQSYAHWRYAEETLVREGHVILGHRGILRKHPMTTIAKNSMQIIRALCQDFGMTPSSRGRMELPEPIEEDDEFEALLDS